MARWQEFEQAEPEMAAGALKLLFQHGVGLGYLATNGTNGFPRLHPFCPTHAGGGLYAFVVPSPKRLDLLRDGRCAIHAFPAEAVDDEFFAQAIARRIDDGATRVMAKQAYTAMGATSSDDEILFEFDLQRCLLATYGPRPSWPPVYTKWSAPWPRESATNGPEH